MWYRYGKFKFIFGNIKNNYISRGDKVLKKKAADMFTELSAIKIPGDKKLSNYYIFSRISPRLYVEFIDDNIEKEIREIKDEFKDSKDLCYFKLHRLATIISQNIFFHFRNADDEDKIILESSLKHALMLISDAVKNLESSNFGIFSIMENFYVEAAISLFSYRLYYEIIVENNYIIPSPAFVYLLLNDSSGDLDKHHSQKDMEYKDKLIKYLIKNFSATYSLVKKSARDIIMLLKDEEFVKRLLKEYNGKFVSYDSVFLCNSSINYFFSDIICSDLSLEDRKFAFLSGLNITLKNLSHSEVLDILSFLDERYSSPSSSPDSFLRIFSEKRTIEVLFTNYIMSTNNRSEYKEIKEKAPFIIRKMSQKYLLEGTDEQMIEKFIQLGAYTKEEVDKFRARRNRQMQSDSASSSESILQQCIDRGCIEKKSISFEKYYNEASRFGFNREEFLRICDKINIYIIHVEEYRKFTGSIFLDGQDLGKVAGFFLPDGEREDGSKGPNIYINCSDNQDEISQSFNEILSKLGAEISFSRQDRTESHELAHSLAREVGFEEITYDDTARGIDRQLDEEAGSIEDSTGDFDEEFAGDASLVNNPSNQSLGYILSPTEAVAFVHGEIPYILNLLKNYLLAAMRSESIQKALRRWAIDEVLKSDDAQMLGLMTGAQIRDYAKTIAQKYSQDEYEIIKKTMERQSGRILEYILETQADNKYNLIASLRETIRKLHERLNEIEEKSEKDFNFDKEREKILFNIKETEERIRNLLKPGNIDTSTSDILRSIVLGYMRQRLPAIFSGEMTAEINDILMEHASYLVDAYSSGEDINDAERGSPLIQDLGMM